MKFRRVWPYLVALVLLPSLRFAKPLAAQDSPGPEWVATMCPPTWRPGPFRGILLIGSFTDFGGYWFNVNWERISGASQALYRPLGGVVPVEVIQHRVEWRNAELVLKCWSRTIVRPSGLTSRVLTEVVVGKRGQLAPHREEGGGACDRAIADPYESYDPYDSEPCRDSSGDSGGGGSGDGSGGDPGCRTEYIVIEISHDGGGTWEVWWEGYATVCE